jgi:hypothetical protein
MNFQKTEPLQCGQHPPSRQQRQLHIVNSTNRIQFRLDVLRKDEFRHLVGGL